MLRESVLVVFCALLLGPALSALAGFDPTLAVYWPLDEGNGRVAHDATGNGINGTISAGPTWVPSGKIGGALNFTVAGDVRGAHVAIDRRSFTIAMWVNPVLAGDQVLFSEVQSASTSLSLYLRIGGPSATAGQVPTNGIRFGFYDDDVDSPANILQSNTWYHLTFRYDSRSKNQSIYVNGVQVATRTTSADFLATAGVICLGSWTGSSYFTGMVDDFQLYQKALSDTEIKNVMEGLSRRFLAKVVSPAEAAMDVPRDAVLSWKPGPYAVTHNVFLGTTFDDVNTATVANSTGQSETTFDPPGLLAYGQTYYWRVDEVNAPPDSTIYKGSVWNFTTEPYTYTIPSATATASSESTAQGMTAVKTVDGSGLNASGQHSSVGADGWLSARTAILPAWIQFQLDRAYVIRQMKVWNSNQKIEPFVGFGAKSVLIECSLDGATWTALKTEEFPQADGTDTYAGFLVDMSDVLAKFVRLTIQSNWGGSFPQSGLSEVRFYYVPVEAWAPQPANYASDVSVGAALDWRPGREAASHTVTFGTDKAAVASGTATSKSVTDHGFTPGALDFGTTYYWKVDEVGATTYPGSIWSFTTHAYAVVEDFESYTDQQGHAIFDSWIDGYTNGNGSLVGYMNSSGGTFGEINLVHSGKQSMPFEYNNIKTPYYSEAERVFDTTQDWTVGGANSLALWYLGYPAGFTDKGNNGPAPLYVTVTDQAGKSKTVVNPNPAAVNASAWTQWQIALSDLAGVNLAAVKKLTIGVGDRANPKAGGAGKLYFDDIGFGKPIQRVLEEILIEAESTTSLTAPLEVYADRPDASGGKYLGSADAGLARTTAAGPGTDGSGLATYTFTVQGGIYTLRGREIVPSTSADSWWVRIKGATLNTKIHASGWIQWNNAPVNNNWAWNYIWSTDDAGKTVLFTMPAGTYTLEIAYREDGCLLDAFMITAQ